MELQAFLLGGESGERLGYRSVRGVSDVSLVGRGLGLISLIMGARLIAFHIDFTDIFYARGKLGQWSRHSELLLVANINRERTRGLEDDLTLAVVNGP